MPTLDLGKVIGPPGPQGEDGPEGEQGIQGPPGAPATINGVNALTIKAGHRIGLEQTGSDLTINAMVNPNLLDNWYSANPIDQRNGHIVNSGVTYYSDAGLTIVAGTTTVPMTVTNGTITINGSTYYVAAADVVRGYTGNGYTIDRWMIVGPLTVVIKEDGITITNTGSVEGYFFQRLDEIAESANGRDLTLSLLTVNGTLYSGTVTFSTTVEKAFYIINNENLNVYLANEKAHPLICVIGVKPGKASSIKAAKLELGSQQTLAHQDANGNWVLNDPPPNKALELAKCQRYQPFVGSPNAGYYGYYPVGGGIAISSTQAIIHVPTPTTIRCAPANPITFTGEFSLRHGGEVFSVVQTANLEMWSQNTIGLRVTIHPENAALTAGEYCETFIRNGMLMPDCNL